MRILVFLSILTAALAVLSSWYRIRRVKEQIAEIADALADVKNGNGGRRILSAANELAAFPMMSGHPLQHSSDILTPPTKDLLRAGTGMNISKRPAGRPTI